MILFLLNKKEWVFKKTKVEEDILLLQAAASLNSDKVLVGNKTAELIPLTTTLLPNHQKL